MQIDLANTLVHKVYFLLVYLFLLSPLWSTISLLPSLGSGWRWAFSPSFGGGWGEAFNSRAARFHPLRSSSSHLSYTF